ncbi:uncharacterized protein HD556DRAFT_1310551 [Suillus plorans]|uniref:Uncharacterized protein n=1 Tax=Suillus plorans TaxID=116603 RepID=A0A9P7AKV3_9AGAM|nr:uncharacterized protein HD556DRAFT_1310551 [Suillus plorans]KAG1790538.1 hypothetical protein HD556DRAFT_1310551 [Suillus plorans]
MYISSQTVIILSIIIIGSINLKIIARSQLLYLAPQGHKCWKNCAKVCVKKNNLLNHVEGKDNTVPDSPHGQAVKESVPGPDAELHISEDEVIRRHLSYMDADRAIRTPCLGKPVHMKSGKMMGWLQL